MGRYKQEHALITGIDIGAGSMRIAVGQLSMDPSLGEELQLIAATEVRSSGINKGIITSIEETVSALSHALEDIERLIGVPVEHAWIGISGTQILFQENRGAVAVAKSDGEIAQEDVFRVIDAAQSISPPLNYDIVHVLPKGYIVDGQLGIKDPVGMNGIRLEVDAQLIYASTPYVKNVMKAVYRTGIDIDDLVLSILATSEVVLTAKQKQLGVCLVNIGSASTTVAVHEDDNILHIGVIPIGSDHVTNDLALGLQTSIEVAEQVKLRYGGCDPTQIDKKEKVDLADFGAPSQLVSTRFIVEIIAARVAEILEHIDAELNEIERRGLLPAGVVFTGGGAKLDGLTDLAKKQLRMNASYGVVRGIQSATDAVNDLAYSTAIGLVKWGMDMQHMSQRGKGKGGFAAGASVAKQVRKLFDFLVP